MEIGEKEFLESVERFLEVIKKVPPGRQMEVIIPLIANIVKAYLFNHSASSKGA
jgi:hypothetical protein